MPEHKEMWAAQQTYTVCICPAHLSALHQVKGFAPPSHIDGHMTKSGPIIMLHLPLPTGIGSGGGYMTKSGPIIVLHLLLPIGIGSGGGHITKSGLIIVLHLLLATGIGSRVGHMTQTSQDFSKWRGGAEERE